MDACNDKLVHTIVVQKSSQVGYTETLLNIIGYYINQDPSPILLINPTLEMSEVFSKTRLAPMLRDTPCLQGAVADARSRDSNNTLLMKNFRGGVLALAGANSPAGLASRPIRVVLCDEVDRFPMSAGSEGDPISLAIKRTTTFHNRKVILGSSPTIKGVSRIEKAFLDSDQRRFYVPCIHCNAMQYLQWSQVKWEKGQPETAVYLCTHCGQSIAEKHKGWMLARGEWRPETPTVQGVAGFHLNELYSPWKRWKDVATDFLRAKNDVALLQTFVNTSLGETWEEIGERRDPTSLQSRAENYSSSTIPRRVLYLTCGVDVQDDRIELEVIGWRKERQDTPPESWGVEYRILYGDPAMATLWETLDAYLMQEWLIQDGRVLRIGATCVDSGGHHTAQVYAFCSSRINRHIYAIKGVPGGKPLWVQRPTKSIKYRANVWLVGTETGKAAWYARLRIAEEGSGYCHFPVTYPESFYIGLTAEQVQTKFVKGRPVREWVCKKGHRNEPLDIRVYALAALEARPINWEALCREQQGEASVAAPKNDGKLPRKSITKRTRL